jgi:hypothetical protein
VLEVVEADVEVGVMVDEVLEAVLEGEKSSTVTTMNDAATMRATTAITITILPTAGFSLPSVIVLPPTARPRATRPSLRTDRTAGQFLVDTALKGERSGDRTGD